MQFEAERVGEGVAGNSWTSFGNESERRCLKSEVSEVRSLWEMKGDGLDT